MIGWQAVLIRHPSYLVIYNNFFILNFFRMNFILVGKVFEGFQLRLPHRILHQSLFLNKIMPRSVLELIVGLLVTSFNLNVIEWPTIILLFFVLYLIVGWMRLAFICSFGLFPIGQFCGTGKFLQLGDVLVLLLNIRQAFWWHIAISWHCVVIEVIVITLTLIHNAAIVARSLTSIFVDW